jgi:hypothetical protein
MTTIDVRQNRWGHAIYARAVGPAGLQVDGCLTPLPRRGDLIVAPNAHLYRVREVRPWGNPGDAFDAELQPLGLIVTAGTAAALPDLSELDIEQALRDV